GSNAVSARWLATKACLGARFALARVFAAALTGRRADDLRAAARDAVLGFRFVVALAMVTSSFVIFRRVGKAKRAHVLSLRWARFALPPLRRKPLSFRRQPRQQRRGLVALLAGARGERDQTIAHVGEAERVGPMHDAAAPGWESVPVDPDHVDVARPRRDPLVEHARALVDHGKQQPLDDLPLLERTARHTEPGRRLEDELLDLRTGFWRARARLVAIEALAGLLAVAAALAQRVGDLG